MKLHEEVKKRFLTLVEFNPIKHSPEGFPRKYTFQELIDKVELIKDLADFITVTESANRIYAVNSIVTANCIKINCEKEVIPHLTVRDHPKQTLESMILTLEGTNFKNILLIKGDDFRKDEIHYEHTYEFVNEVKKLKPNLSIGVAGNPLYNRDKEIENIKAKTDAGADFIITQAIFSSDSYCEYREDLEKNNIYVPIIAGILPVKGRKTIEFVEKKMKEVKIPDDLKEWILGVEDPRSRCIRNVKDIIENLKKKDCYGIDIYSRGDAQLVYDILN
ncbi:methylenetetrahydrofolate reductase [Candidatus Woesearchaeota archaeon]|nr:methylenetetrahydrofolate reductase [Candidatus Woesearchaeota archaeon]